METKSNAGNQLYQQIIRDIFSRIRFSLGLVHIKFVSFTVPNCLLYCKSFVKKMLYISIRV